MSSRAPTPGTPHTPSRRRARNGPRTQIRQGDAAHPRLHRSARPRGGRDELTAQAHRGRTRSCAGSRRRQGRSSSLRCGRSTLTPTARRRNHAAIDPDGPETTKTDPTLFTGGPITDKSGRFQRREPVDDEEHVPHRRRRQPGLLAGAAGDTARPDITLGAPLARIEWLVVRGLAQFDPRQCPIDRAGVHGGHRRGLLWTLGPHRTVCTLPRSNDGLASGLLDRH